MQDLYEIIKGSLFFNGFIHREMVCVEYTCPLKEEHLGVYSKHDYIIHILSGKKTWKTIDSSWTVKKGDTLFVKKGTVILTQSFEADFCLLAFFLPDDIIRESLQEMVHKIPVSKSDLAGQFTAAPLNQGSYLDVFFQSMLVYFKNKEQPPESIIKLKLKELLINVVSNTDNLNLISYLKFLTENESISLPHIMEANFCYNLSLEEFAKLTHRSLSTFKRDFQSHYGITPGKWLLSKRLDFAAGMLLHNHTKNISQIAFECGFEDVSHFSKVFRRKFGCNPTLYREKIISGTNV